MRTPGSHSEAIQHRRPTVSRLSALLLVAALMFIAPLLVAALADAAPPPTAGPSEPLPPQAGGPGGPEDDEPTATPTPTSTSAPVSTATPTPTLPVELRHVGVSFTAGSFGGGPNRGGCAPGAPICSLSGSLVVQYDANRLGTMALTSFSVSAYSTLNASNMSVSLTASGGKTYLVATSVHPAPYFTVRFEFDARNPVVGTVTAANAAYRSGSQIYQSRTGSATITSVE